MHNASQAYEEEYDSRFSYAYQQLKKEPFEFLRANKLATSKNDYTYDNRPFYTRAVYVLRMAAMEDPQAAECARDLLYDIADFYARKGGENEHTSSHPNA